MRLPDEADRRIAGKSAGLNDDQLDELARLPKGVALVYQNDWLEPVLCRINKFAGEEETYRYEATAVSSGNAQLYNQQLIAWLMASRLRQPLEISLENLEVGLEGSPLATGQKIVLKTLFEEFRTTGKISLQNEQHFARLAKLVVNLLDCNSAIERCVRTTPGFDELAQSFHQLIVNQTGELPSGLELAVQQCFMRELAGRNDEYLKVYAAWRKYVTPETVA